MDKALKLYLKAAEAAGNRDLVKRILALREEESNEIINENENSDNLDREPEIRYNKKRLYKQISKREYAVISSRIMEDNSKLMARNQELPRYGKARSFDYFYVYENFAPGYFGVLKQIKITDTNREYIASIEAKIGENNGEQTIGSTSELNRVLEILKTRTRGNRSNNALDSEGRADSVNGGVSLGKSASDGIGYSQKGGRDSGNAINETKYSRKTDQERSTLTKGEAQKQKANYESDKVYTKAEISKMVESLSGLSSIPKRFRTEIVNDIWTAFNSRYSPEQRERHASFLADKIFARVMQESGDAFDNTSQEDLYAMEREIHKALKKIAREGGSPSTRSKLEAEFNTSEAGYWKNVSTKLSSRNRGRFSGTKIKPEGSPIPNRLQIQAFAGSPLGRAPASAGERVVWNIIGFPLAKA